MATILVVFLFGTGGQVHRPSSVCKCSRDDAYIREMTHILATRRIYSRGDVYPRPGTQISAGLAHILATRRIYSRVDANPRHQTHISEG